MRLTPSATPTRHSNGDVQALHDAINNRTSDLMPYNAGVSNDCEAEAAARQPGSGHRAGVPGEHRSTRLPAGSRVSVVASSTCSATRRVAPAMWSSSGPTPTPRLPARTSPSASCSTTRAAWAGRPRNWPRPGTPPRLACQALDIPCTVTLWDTQATVLFDATEVAEQLPVIVSAGGTDPTVAVADLDNQRYDKDIHLVIIMTDGAWGGATGQPGFLATYKGDDGPVLHRPRLQQRLGRLGSGHGREPAPLRVRRGPQHRLPDGDSPVLGAGAGRLLLTDPPAEARSAPKALRAFGHHLPRGSP